MTMLSLRPSDIRFSQDSIAYYFGYGRFAGILIGQTLDDLLQGECKVSDIPTITVSSRDGLWYSGDNKRLWVFRKCEELGIIDRVPAEEGYISSSKFTTDNRGVSIRVRGNPGGRLWTQRNRKDLVIKDPEPPKPVEPARPVINIAPINVVHQPVQNISADVKYRTTAGQANPSFVGDEDDPDQQNVTGIKDLGSEDVDLSSLEGGPLSCGQPASEDVQHSITLEIDNNHLTASTGPKDSVDVELGHKVREPCQTNRRLWVFRKCEELGILDRVPAEEGYISSSKFTTDNRGVSIRVRGNLGGRLWTQRNRKDLVIKDPEPPKPVEPDRPVINIAPSNVVHPPVQNISADVNYRTTAGQANPCFGEDEDDPDQQNVTGIKDLGSEDVDLSSLEGGPIPCGQPASEDLQHSITLEIDNNHLTASTGPKDSVDVELGHKVREPCQTNMSGNTIASVLENCSFQWSIVIIFVGVLYVIASLVDLLVPL